MRAWLVSISLLASLEAFAQDVAVETQATNIATSVVPSNKSINELTDDLMRLLKESGATENDIQDIQNLTESVIKSTNTSGEMNPTYSEQKNGNDLIKSDGSNDDAEESLGLENLFDESESGKISTQDKTDNDGNKSNETDNSNDKNSEIQNAKDSSSLEVEKDISILEEENDKSELELDKELSELEEIDDQSEIENESSKILGGKDAYELENLSDKSIFKKDFSELSEDGVLDKDFDDSEIESTISESDLSDDINAANIEDTLDTRDLEDDDTPDDEFEGELEDENIINGTEQDDDLDFNDNSYEEHPIITRNFKMPKPQSYSQFNRGNNSSTDFQDKQSGNDSWNPEERSINTHTFNRQRPQQYSQFNNGRNEPNDYDDEQFGNDDLDNGNRYGNQRYNQQSSRQYSNSNRKKRQPEPDYENDQFGNDNDSDYQNDRSRTNSAPYNDRQQYDNWHTYENGYNNQYANNYPQYGNGQEQMPLQQGTQVIPNGGLTQQAAQPQPFSQNNNSNSNNVAVKQSNAVPQNVVKEKKTPAKPKPKKKKVVAKLSPPQYCCPKVIYIPYCSSKCLPMPPNFMTPNMVPNICPINLDIPKKCCSESIVDFKNKKKNIQKVNKLWIVS